MKKLSELRQSTQKVTIQESSLTQGDRITIKSGRYAGQSGIIDMILSNGYVVDLDNGKKIEVSNSDV